MSSSWSLSSDSSAFDNNNEGDEVVIEDPECLILPPPYQRYYEIQDDERPSSLLECQGHDGRLDMKKFLLYREKEKELEDEDDNMLKRMMPSGDSHLNRKRQKLNHKRRQGRYQIDLLVQSQLDEQQWLQPLDEVITKREEDKEDNNKELWRKRQMECFRELDKIRKRREPIWEKSMELMKLEY